MCKRWRIGHQTLQTLFQTGSQQGLATLSTCSCLKKESSRSCPNRPRKVPAISLDSRRLLGRSPYSQGAVLRRVIGLALVLDAAAQHSGLAADVSTQCTCKYFLCVLEVLVVVMFRL